MLCYALDKGDPTTAGAHARRCAPPRETPTDKGTHITPPPPHTPPPCTRNSYIGAVWHAFSSPLPLYPDNDHLFDFALAHYEEPLRALVGNGVVPDGSGALVFPSSQDDDYWTSASKQEKEEEKVKEKEKSNDDAPRSVSKRSRAHRRSSTPRLHSNSWIGRGTSVLRDETARVDYEAVARVVDFGAENAVGAGNGGNGEEEEEEEEKEEEDKKREEEEKQEEDKARTNKRPPLSQWTFVKYAQLRSDLKSTIIKMFARLQMRPVLDSGILQAQEDKARAYRSTHVHSPSECCGMNADELRKRFETVFDRIDFGKME